MAKRAPKPLSEKGEALRKRGQMWLERIEAAWKREDTWAKEAEKAVKAYTNETSGTGTLYDYNILHANVETIVPAIINSPPVPDVRRRFGDSDPVGKQLSDILERSIMVQVDDSRLATELESQAQDGFLAGRGVIRLRFHADTQETETSALEEAEDAADTDDLGTGRVAGGEREDGGAYDAADPDADEGEDAAGEGSGAQSASVSNERITFEAVSWRDYQHGPAKRWEDRPWESYRHTMQCEDVRDFADRTLVSEQTAPGGDVFGEVGSDQTIYEIWDKRGRKVVFIDENGRLLKELPDPLGLSNFFPSSRPVQPIEIVGRLMPVTPFSIYQKLADELDIITKRIRVLTAAMKIKGGLIGAIATDLKALAEAEDNEIVTLSGIEALAQTAGLDKAILWWPVDKFYPVLAELFKNRDLTKQAIYEITGISDIVRGATKASETLGAQQIKSQWGALRIQKMQRMMERSARDLFVMMAEIIPAKFSHATLERMTAVPIMVRPTDSPEIVQQKLQLQQLMQQKVTTAYRVDVESQSTVRADLTMKKQEMSEFLAGSAAYFQGMAPIVQAGGPDAMEGVLAIYGAASRNFDLGKSAEDALDKMLTTATKAAEDAKNNPQPPKPTPEEIAAQGKAEKDRADGQAAIAKAQGDAETARAEAAKTAAEAQVSVLEAQAENTRAQTEQAAAAVEAEIKRREQDRKDMEQAAKTAHDQRIRDVELQIKNTDLAIKEADLLMAGVETEPGEPNADGTPGKPKRVNRTSKVMDDLTTQQGALQQSLMAVHQTVAELAQAQKTKPKRMKITTPRGDTYFAEGHDD